MTRALLLLLVSCSGTPASPATHPPPSASEAIPSEPSPSEPPPSEPSPLAPAVDPVRVRALACGYGGSATAVSGFLDVETDVALHGLTATYELRDPSGVPCGHNQGAVTLLVSPPARGTHDFSTQGTTPFAGDLAAGARTRLQYFGGVDALPPSTGGPLEVRVTLTAAGGRHWNATCTTATEWPSS